MATLCCGIILFDGAKVLLVKHTKSARLPEGFYGFPAGRIEDGETLEDAAIRELKQESGLVTTAEHLRKVDERHSLLKMADGNSEEFEFHVFYCDKYWGELGSLEDKTVAEFVPLGNLDNIKVVSKDVRELSRRVYEKFMPKAR